MNNLTCEQKDMGSMLINVDWLICVWFKDTGKNNLLEIIMKQLTFNDVFGS